MTLVKAGGIAAFVQALTYLVGFALLATWLNPGDSAAWSPAQKLAFVLQNKALFQAWTLFIYVVFGIALVVLTLALHERLKARSVALMQIATVFGLIWAVLVIASGMVASVGLETVATLHPRDTELAISTWIAVSAIQDGLGGGVEVVGGLWMLLVSLAAWRSAEWPRGLNYLGVGAGSAGMLTLMPPLGELGAAFGLGQIVWFAWLGVLLFRQPSPRASFETVREEGRALQALHGPQ